MEDPAWLLARLTVELLRPVPIAPLSFELDVSGGKTVRRVTVSLWHEQKEVAGAVGLFVKGQNLPLPMHPSGSLPGPDECSAKVAIPGMQNIRSFHYTAMESRIASGQIDQPGPAAAWLRLRVPLIAGTPNSPAMRVCAAADLGNGISWTLPVDRYRFANTDMTLYLTRPPAGEWIGVDAITENGDFGLGLTRSTLFDIEGAVGVALQSLLIQQR